MKTQFRHTAVLSLAVLCLAYVHSQEYQDGYGGGGGGGYAYNNGYDDNGGGGGGGDVDRQYTSTYGQDTLFEDYAEGKIRKVEGGGGGVLPAAVTTIVGWFVGGKIHSGKAISKLKRKHQREQKDLYTTYYNDIYKLQLQNAELSKTVNTLQNAVRELEERIQLESLQRDYDEFKQPDIDGDDMISRAEFNLYVQNYLKNYPGLSPDDYPKWEDFDQDGDGFITFAEYEQQMAIQMSSEKETQKYSRSTNNDYKIAGLTNLFRETQYADNFDDLFENFFG